MERIIILGPPGSGKTTLARRIAARLGCVHIETDAVFWEGGGDSFSLEEFRRRVDAAARPDGQWVLEGHDSKLRDLTWPRATLRVWLDYPPWLVGGRALKRFFSERASAGRRDSSFERLVTALQLIGPRTREYRALLGRKEPQVLRLRSPAETERWLRALSQPGSS